MADGEVKIVFRTEAELKGAEQLQQSLERQIGAAKASHKPYADLEQQHKAVSTSISQHNDAAKSQEGVYQAVNTATAKATERQAGLREALRGAGLQFPILGRLIETVLNPLGAITAAVSIAMAALGRLFSEGNRAADQFDVSDKLAAQATGSAAAAEEFARAATTFATGMDRIRKGAEPLGAAVRDALESLKALQQLQIESEDKDLAAEVATIREDEASGRIKPSEGIKRRKEAEDASRLRRKTIEEDQAAQQRAVIEDGIKKAAAAEDEALKQRQAPEVLSAGQAASKEHSEFAADVRRRVEKKRPDLEKELFKVTTEGADLSSGRGLQGWWTNMGLPGKGATEFLGIPIGGGSIRSEQQRMIKERSDRAAEIKDEMASGDSQIQQAEATARKSQAEEKKRIEAQKKAESDAEEAAKTRRELEAKLKVEDQQREITSPIRARINESSDIIRESTYRADLGRAEREEKEKELLAEEKRKREAERIEKEAAAKAEKEEKRQRDRESRNFNSGGTSPDLSAATDGIRASVENLAQLPQATQALAMATGDAVSALWQAVADIRGRQRDGLS